MSFLNFIFQPFIKSQITQRSNGAVFKKYFAGAVTHLDSNNKYTDYCLTGLKKVLELLDQRFENLNEKNSSIARTPKKVIELNKEELEEQIKNLSKNDREFFDHVGDGLKFTLQHRDLISSAIKIDDIYIKLEGMKDAENIMSSVPVMRCVLIATKKYAYLASLTEDFKNKNVWTSEEIKRLPDVQVF